MNKRSVGASYEGIACDYLKNRGYTILEKNYRNRAGEIDIIAMDGEYICFIEVKYRRDRGCGMPLEAVNFKKQKNIIKVAKYYLMMKGHTEWTPCRFDVVAIEGEDITLLQNAFEGA